MRRPGQGNLRAEPSVAGRGRSLRVWSEHLPYAELRARPTLRLLRDRSIRLLLGVEPTHLSELEPTLAACGEAGLSVGLWPLLENERGRWASVRNASAYAEHLSSVMEAAGRSRTLVSEVAFDLEPSFAATRLVATRSVGEAVRAARLPKRSRPGSSGAGRASVRGGDTASWRSAAAARLAESMDELARQGIGATAVVLPHVLGDRPGRRGFFQSALGTPVEGLPARHVEVMAYTSLIEGYSSGLLRRPDALHLLREICRAARRRWGPAAGIALGVAGGGALGDERPLRDARELAEDVAVARAQGIERLSLYGLEGILARGAPERWLDAFTGAADARTETPFTLRSAALVWLGRAAGRALDPVSRAFWDEG